ncbi:MAG: RNA methyltransferase [Flavobacteriales bacterium]|nr:RNA methyltransferase [Flavobacteriales bacterium]
MPANDRKLSDEELGRIDPDTYRRMVKRPVQFILDNIRSRHNVGSIFRTADAFGLERLVLCGLTPCPPHRDIEKTALGATASVPWTHRTAALDVVFDLQAKGYRVLAFEQTALALSLNEVRPLSGVPVALVLGNELHGVDDAVVQACDSCLTVPQIGTKHSLNVSVCAGIAAWWSLQAFGPPEP